MRRQRWMVELIDEAISACSDKLAILENNDGRDYRQNTRLRQALAALRADRAKYWRREERESQRARTTKEQP